jgi:hypothetical protein
MEAAAVGEKDGSLGWIGPRQLHWTRVATVAWP